MSHDRGAQRGGPASSASSSAAASPASAPGRRTLTQDLPGHGAVQCKADGAAPDAAAMHRAADQGISGSGSALPHLGTIQRLFGRHDVGHVAAHVGGAATEAAHSMGAQAYALGDHVAFRSAPDLHTAAHEAAHVVQQRAGVHLKDNVGSAGDAYERHADAVADRVVKGESAESLLDEMGGGGGGGRAIQMIRTYGGDFDANPYTPYSAGSMRGATIEITFTPNDLVVAPKIGMTQTVKSLQGGTNTYAFGPPTEQAERQGRANTAAQGDEGRYIDRTGERTNPMYGIDNPPAGTGITGATTSQFSNARIGHRNLDPVTGRPDVAPAWMYDQPKLSWSAGTALEQIFETTALAMEGAMAGTYLGSVEWGVRTDATTGVAAKIPFRLVSMGVPTAEFMASTGNWNAQSMWVRDRVVAPGPGTVASTAALVAGTAYPANTVIMTITTGAGPVDVRMPIDATFDSFLVARGGAVTAGQQLAVFRTQQASADLPTTSHTTVDPSTLNDQQLETRMRELNDRILHMDRASTDYQNMRFEIRGLGEEAVRRGTDAVDSGHTYTIRSGDTLWGVATAHLGGGPRWTRILALNAAAIQDPNIIRPGGVLKMPRPYHP